MAEAAEWQVGNEALCNGRRAIVRFVGETHFASGLWVGVEFTKASAGRHDGSVDGTRYFGPTAPNHGLFVRYDGGDGALQLYTPQDEAATLLQAQVRRKKDAEAAHYAQVSRAFGEMESRAECDQLRSNRQCTRTAYVLQDEDSSPQLGRVPSLAATLPPPDEPEEEVLPTARGAPRLRFEESADGRTSVPRDCLDEVLRHFKTPGGCAPLAPNCVLRLQKHGSDLLRRHVRSALHEVSLPPAPGRCVVLGDTHGQLEDVLWVFFEHGLPSPENVYLFNGDVCDRGYGAVEILVLILLFKLWNPACIYMNRGNHEDPCMNDCYGFRDECVDKWGPSRGAEIFEGFNALFQLLPLFTLVDSSVFVVHGGLWRKDFTLAQLKRVDYRRPLPERPGLGLDVVVFDSVWSDPHQNKGVGSNPRGDAIISFGEDVTRRFLRANHLQLLVRSHQVPDSGNGFEWWHNKKCLTVFSASNYCGDCGNLGAVLVLARGEEHQVVEHWALPLEELAQLEAEAESAQERIQRIRSQRQVRRSASQRMEADIVRRVSEQVVRRKTELFEYWSGLDTSPPGVFRISAAHWREGLAALVDDSLPWVRLQEVMGVADGEGGVHYVKFLTRFRAAFDASFGISAAGWEKAVWSKLMETLLRADLPLREALAALDATNDGLVSGVEFGRLLESCHVGISGLQARALLRTLAMRPVEPEQGSDAAGAPAASAGRVSVWDMLGRLQVTLPVSRAAGDAGAEAWAVPKLRPLATAVLDDAWKRLVPPGAQASEWPVPKLLAAWFEDVDESRNGFLETNEFVTALQRLAPALQKGGCPADTPSLERLAAYCDVVGNGRVNYFELMNGLTWEDSLGPELREDMMETLNAAIYFNMAPTRRALQRFDPQGAGRISPEDFVTAMRGVNKALGPDGGALSPSEVQELVVHLPRKECGKIDYDSFLKSFRIVDTLSLGIGAKP